MEKMGSFAMDPKSGQLYQLRPGGWTPVSEDAVSAPQGVLPSAVRSAAQLGLGTYDLVGKLAGSDAGVGPAMQKLDEAQQAGMAQSPLSTTIGNWTPDALMAAGPLVMGAKAAAGAAASLPARMAERVSASITGRARQAAARAEAQQAEIGARSVGAAEAAGATPDLLPDAMGGGMIERLLTDAPLTADQTRLLPIGRRLGFQDIPGMTGRADSPGKMYAAAMLGRPDVRMALQPQLEANAANLERLALRAEGAPEGARWGTEAHAAARQSTGRLFDQVREAVPATVTLPETFIAGAEKLGKGIGPEVRAVMEQLFTEGADGEMIRTGARLSREDLFALRSDLNLLAQDLAAAPGRRLASNRIGSLSNQLDEFINEMLTPELQATWHRARVQYLVQKLLEKPGIMQPDGSMSLRSARTVLNREMPDAFRQTLEGSRATLTPEVRDFMDGVDYASAFTDLVPNSGTATRLSLSNMTVRQWAQGRALRWMLQQEMQRPPVP